jgi:hypothetical protein
MSTCSVVALAGKGRQAFDAEPVLRNGGQSELVYRMLALGCCRTAGHFRADREIRGRSLRPLGVGDGSFWWPGRMILEGGVCDGTSVEGHPAPEAGSGAGGAVQTEDGQPVCRELCVSETAVDGKARLTGCELAGRELRKSRISFRLTTASTLGPPGSGWEVLPLPGFRNRPWSSP